MAKKYCGEPTAQNLLDYGFKTAAIRVKKS
jgi:hypothetical protein